MIRMKPDELALLDKEVQRLSELRPMGLGEATRSDVLRLSLREFAATKSNPYRAKE